MQVDRKRDFSADGLIGFVKEEFDKVVDHRVGEVGIRLGDALQSAYAMFALKSPSLLAFDNEMDANPNLKRIFKIERVPSDTQMRVILDNVNPNSLRKPFSKLFSKLQRAELLEKYQVLNGHYALSSDGTGYFSSKTVHCENCMQKKSRGEITYYHQMYGVSLVHPDNKVVIPLMPEPIMNQDGKVNFLEYFEVDDKKKKELHFTWVTDIPLSGDNVYEIMKVARARWRIENETFNTLKNQGYHFEHNFGHGNNNLSTVFAVTMMLAFLTDQIQQLAYPLFQEALRVAKRKVYFWNSPSPFLR